jgi:hypothetical protein
LYNMPVLCCMRWYRFTLVMIVLQEEEDK